MSQPDSIANLLPPSQQAKLSRAVRGLLPGLLAAEDAAPEIANRDGLIEQLDERELGTLWPLICAIEGEDRPAGKLAQTIHYATVQRHLEPVLDADAALILFSQVENITYIYALLEQVERPLAPALIPHLHRRLAQMDDKTILEDIFRLLRMARSIDAESVTILTRRYHEACGPDSPRPRELEAVKTFSDPDLDVYCTWAYRVWAGFTDLPIPDLPRNAAYADAARATLGEVRERLERIHDGSIAYQADRAYPSSETDTVKRAAHAAASWREPWFGEFIKHGLPLACVAPTAAKTAPSQALAIALGKIVEAYPTVDSVQALREALRVVRHAGVQKKLQRHLKPAERALMNSAGSEESLVPDLGLDAAGTMVLDFGSRHFTVAFDETLTPLVCDTAGTRLKALPKPNKGDDATLAEAAAERYKQLKKDVKSVASFQIARLENAMASGRRWPLDAFVEQFVRHPLLRHLAARLAWIEYREGRPAQLFRIAEDWSLADSEDRAYAPAAGSEIGLAHVLTAAASDWQAMGRVFADYEILQPLRQFGRETHALREEEKGASEIDRFRGKQIAMGGIMGLLGRGWTARVFEGKWVGAFEKRLPGGQTASMEISPGYLSFQKITEHQTLESLSLTHNKAAVPFAALDEVTASELLREFDLLRDARNAA